MVYFRPFCKDQLARCATVSGNVDASTLRQVTSKKKRKIEIRKSKRAAIFEFQNSILAGASLLTHHLSPLS